MLQEGNTHGKLWRNVWPNRE